MEDQKIKIEVSKPRQKKYVSKDNFLKYYEPPTTLKITIDAKDPELKVNEDDANDRKEFIDYDIKHTENRILDRCQNEMLLNKWGSLREIYDDEFQILTKKIGNETAESKFMSFDNLKSKVSKRIQNDFARTWSKKNCFKIKTIFDYFCFCS